MSIDNLTMNINKRFNNNDSWNQVESKLGIITSKELVDCLSYEDEVDPEYETKERHIIPNHFYFEDADNHTQNDKPLTKTQLEKRIQKVYR